MPIRRRPTRNRSPQRRPLLATALLLSLLAGLAACGQKGPLRQPGDEPATESIQSP
ncbi:MAG: LPS translocon maturation chaperone LptM [Pseudomonadota bacterium]